VALATVVGVLVEVPVMLSVVRLVLRSRAWYGRALGFPIRQADWRRAI
jgi:ACR3 family arsenite transporter